MTSEEYDQGYDDGLKVGRQIGEFERVALAAANSELRSILRQHTGETPWNASA